jgi:transposase
VRRLFIRASFEAEGCDASRLQGGHRMKLHANAALSLRQRRRMVLLVVEDGWTIKAAAAAFATSEKTCGKWVSRYRAAGECGLLAGSSAPVRVANRTEDDRVQAIAALRRLRFSGPEVAETLGRHRPPTAHHTAEQPARDLHLARLGAPANVNGGGVREAGSARL